MGKRAKNALGRGVDISGIEVPRDSKAALDKEIADLERKIRDATARRDAADKVLMELCDRIMESVKEQEGEDSELYAAMVFAGLKTHGCH